VSTCVSTQLKPAHMKRLKQNRLIEKFAKASHMRLFVEGMEK